MVPMILWKMWGREMRKWLAVGHRYCCFMEGYPIYIGTACMLYRQRENIHNVVENTVFAVPLLMLWNTAPFEGDVRCWGDGEHGALGTGDEKHTGDGKRDIADSVDLGVGTSAITAIGSGPCAITEDGMMKVDDVLYWTCSGSPMGRTTTSHPRRSRQRTHIANTLNISARFVVVSL